ncbi:uncharacterized protein [Spinacia oleracea]|uniref:Factor of DNA methylation 1-5/IDN2 domain-containing protein n=1 Tax=Spinacia oleracea TaxID=3562 RepID=A0ABM3R0I3_SPIOL|nr:uncharacterized protein LOC130463860 [Spinacia oleracea]
MSKLSEADKGKGDMTDWMADIYEAKMKKAKAKLEEKLFCRMEFCKSWKTNTAEELKTQVDVSVHHGDYAFKSIEEVRLEMQTTIDLQAKELASLKSNKVELLKRILKQDKDIMEMVEEGKKAAAEIQTLQEQLQEYPQVKEAAGHAEWLKGELETARSQVPTLRERLHESYDQGEQAVKDAVKHALENHMEEHDPAWFQRCLEHSAAVLAAERLGQPPREFATSCFYKKSFLMFLCLRAKTISISVFCAAGVCTIVPAEHTTISFSFPTFARLTMAVVL